MIDSATVHASNYELLIKANMILDCIRQQFFMQNQGNIGYVNPAPDFTLKKEYSS